MKMSSYQRPRVLIVDDDVTHVRMLAEYLSIEGFVVDTAFNGTDGVDAALNGGFDAVILDIMLPHLPGTEALRLIRQESEIPILMLSAKGDDVDRVIGLELGADDYLAKPFYPRELVARLRAIMRRQNGASFAASEKPLTNGTVTIDSERREARAGSTVVDLTVSEFNILLALLANQGKVLSKDDLSQQALNRKRANYDRSIDVHVSKLRHKLSEADCADHGIETVRGFGYRMVAVP